MIFNVGAGGTTDADKIKYGDSNVGATLDNLNENVDELQEDVSTLNESLNNVVDKTVTFGSAYTTEDISCQKIGKIVVLTFTLRGTNIASGSTIGSVSDLPRKRAYINAQIRNSEGRHCAVVSVETNGNILLHHSIANAHTVIASITYVCE